MIRRRTQQIAVREYSQKIIMHHEEHDQRTGQYLFNSFPSEISKHITGQLWDPFNRSMSQYQIEKWLLEHVIFNDNGEIVGLFNKNDMLWERNF